MRLPCRACDGAGLDWRGEECSTCHGAGTIEPGTLRPVKPDPELQLALTIEEPSS